MVLGVFLQAGHWKCPRHSIACECAPGSEATEHLLPVVSAQWESDGDRRAVLTKLADCGVRTVSALKKVIGTPVWEARLPRTCWFRYQCTAAPCLALRVNVQGPSSAKVWMPVDEVGQRDSCTESGNNCDTLDTQGGANASQRVAV